MSLYYLYLSRPARALLPDALRAGYWGLSDETAHKSLERLGQPVTSLEVLHELQVDDQVLVGAGGPQARVPRGEWADITLAEGFIWRVTSPYFYSSEPPLADRPHRFGIEDWSSSRTSRRMTQARMVWMYLHYSANGGGLLVRAVARAIPGADPRRPAIAWADGGGPWPARAGRPAGRGALDAPSPRAARDPGQALSSARGHLRHLCPNTSRLS